jgi:hypothetical protein
MVLLPRDDREPRLDLSCRRPILLGSASSSTSLRRSRAPPPCCDSVAMEQQADTADAHSKRRF